MGKREKVGDTFLRKKSEEKPKQCSLYDIFRWKKYNFSSEIEIRRWMKNRLNKDIKKRELLKISNGYNWDKSRD